MPQRILIPVDESAISERTTEFVTNNQDLFPGEITLLHVVDVQLVQRLVPDIQKNMIYASAEKSGHRILETLARPFFAAGLSPALRLELGTPEEAIPEVVTLLGIDLVVIGRHLDRSSFQNIMFGSLSNELIRKLECPVLLI